MNSIEEQLWDYIDGTCTAAQRSAIDLLLTTDDTWQQKYRELLAFNREITAMDLEEPSMAFSYKVMENIRADYAKAPLKAAIDGRIVKLIGGFFIVSIAALLIYVFTTVNWSAGNTVSLPEIKIPLTKNFMSSGLFEGFMFFDVVLGLFLLDGFLRKKGIAGQS